MPLLSVIIPSYNSAGTIGRCMESIVQQTLRDIEIIVIDDGSSDESLDICYQFAARDNRISIYSKANAGQGIARNYGLDQATGDFVAFVDSDDTCPAEMYETLVNRAIIEQSDLVIAGYTDVRNGKVIKEHPGSLDLQLEGTRIQTYMAGLVSDFEKDDEEKCIAVWDSIYRRSLLKNNHVRFPSERDVYSEDLIFKMRSMAVANKISCIPECLYEYHISDKSYSKRIDDGVFSRLLTLYKLLDSEFGEKLKSLSFDTRNKMRLFRSLRYALGRAPIMKGRCDFFRKLTREDVLYDCISSFRPKTVTDTILLSVIKTRNWLVISVAFSLYHLKGHI